MGGGRGLMLISPHSAKGEGCACTRLWWAGRGRVYHGTDGKVCEGVVTEAYASSRVRMLMDEHMGHRTKLWYT